jgi:site-specific DNA-methyltransferase (adenine-specific)
VTTALAIRDEQPLEPLSTAKAVIARAVADGDAAVLKELRGRASAVELYQRRSGARDVANDAGEIKVRAERALGQLDAKAVPGKTNHKHLRSPEDAPLAELHPESRATWRRLGGLSDRKFDRLVDQARSDEDAAVSTAHLIRLHKWAGRKQRYDKLAVERAQAEAAARTSGLRSEVIHADLRQWRPTGIDAIVTDPPYITDNAVELHSALADFAVDVLPDGGPLVVMTWQAILPDVLAAMARPQLIYRWTIAWTYETNERTPDRARRVFDGWKPILVFHKTCVPADATYIYDLIRSENLDKGSHEWGQSIDGFRRLVKAASEPGQTVCDPFVGGGTTAIAALAEARNFVGCDIAAEAITTTRERLAA